MHVVIGGYGRVGRYLASMLESQGHSVAVIDRNDHAFAESRVDIKGRRLKGEVFDRDTLIKAGIEHADAFAAVTSGDNSNIVAARLARERFNVPCVVARIYDPNRAAIYERFGIPTVSSVRWASAVLLATIIDPDVHTVSVYGGGEVVTISVLAHEAIAGKRISDLEVPGKFHVTAMTRDFVALIPSPSLEIHVADRLKITVARDDMPELKRLVGLE
ncbi:MAG TPA: TrkA family potassium uptake protein [Coriobacteriia bacterium]|nr:TrkA family potassium uptake protein [Coriobacteriia bacterium]